MIRDRFLALFLIPASAFAASCGPAPVAVAVAAEEQAQALEPTSTTVFGERLLLFMEYPHLVRGAPARFLAHLTVLETGEPVRSGSVVLEIGSSHFTVEAPKREGLFIPEGSLPEHGTFSGKLVVHSEQAQETLDLGELLVHATEEDAVLAAGSEPEDEPASAVPFLLEQQWKVKLLLAEAEPRSLAKRLLVPAQVAAPEGAAALVSAPLGGHLLAPTSGAFPRSGERVEAGQVLALVEPPLAALDQAQLQALDLEFDLKALEILRAIGESQVRLRFSEREVERLGGLREEGLSTQQQVDLAEQNLALAQREGEAAAGMKASLDALVESRGKRPGAPALRQLPLTAPIAGTLTEVRHVRGESVGPEEPVFRLLDSSRLWVEGRVLEFDLPLVLGAAGATATFSALPGRRFELSPSDAGGRPYVGQEVDPASRTVLVRYELDNPDAAVRAGMLAELAIATASVDAPVAVPSGAVVMEQGIPTAYVMLAGELFQKRELELGVKDGGWVEVQRGIEPGERVATRGAYLVKLAALSPASFGAGHAH